MTNPKLTVLAGPTAVGKGTVAKYLAAHYPDVWISISATTRPPRTGEIDGVHYHFVSDAAFAQMIADEELLEWATVHQVAKYGTPKTPVAAALAAGKLPLLEIDLQGARQVRKVLPEANFVFLNPPSWTELVARLVGRGTENSAEQERRLATAKIELAAASEFDYQLVNDEVPIVAAQLYQLMRNS